MRVIVAIISLIGIAAWSGVIYVGLIMSQFMGAGLRIGASDIFGMSVPYAYFLFSFVSCFSFVSGNAHKLGGIIAHLLLAGFVVVVLVFAEPHLKLIYGLSATVSALMWGAMLKGRIRSERAQQAATRSSLNHMPESIVDGAPNSQL